MSTYEGQHSFAVLDTFSSDTATVLHASGQVIGPKLTYVSEFAGESDKYHVVIAEGSHVTLASTEYP